jgi:transcriptional regulator with XRE-family HTH domain
VDTTCKMQRLNRQIKAIGITAIAEASGLNKSTISRYVNGEREYSLENFNKITKAVREIEKKSLFGRTSAYEATQRVYLSEDWQIAYFDFVDSFLATQNRLLFLDRPAEGLDIKHLALICSIVMQLCESVKVQPPEWAKVNIEFEKPWFISKFDSLRDVCLVDSPIFLEK